VNFGELLKRISWNTVRHDFDVAPDLKYHEYKAYLEKSNVTDQPFMYQRLTQIGKERWPEEFI